MWNSNEQSCLDRERRRRRRRGGRDKEDNVNPPDGDTQTSVCGTDQW